MATAGLTVSETILVELSTVKSVAQRITLAMTQDGSYRLCSTAPGRLEFERRFKPSWGMGAFSKTERCSITAEQAPTAIVVRVEGVVLEARLDAVRAAVTGRSIATAELDAVLGPARVTPRLEGLEGPPPQGVDSSEGIPPVRQSAPERDAWPVPRPDPNPEPIEAPGPVQAMPVGPDSSSPPLLDSASGRAGSLMLYLDLGEAGTISLDQRIVLGRDPVPPSGKPGKAVRITDVTVSKTHCWIEPSGDGALICDLYSTNGTAVVDSHGRRVAVNPESPSLAARGATIALGDYTLTVAAVIGARRTQP